MIDSQAPSPQPPAAQSRIDEEFDLFGYFRVIWRRRRMLVLLCLLAMSVTVAVSLTRPRQYQAMVAVVPPLDILQRESAGGLGLLDNPLLRQVMGSAATDVSKMYAEILASREVADAIIDRFDLMNVYENVQYRINARRRLKKNTKIEMTDAGAVTVTVLDRDPNRVAAMAGAYIEELDRQNKRLSAGQATSKRVFLEGRLQEIEARLSKVDNMLSREAKNQEMLYEMLVQQYELAKIDEAKSMPTIQILDPPVVPERGVPRGTVAKGLLAGVAAFLLGVFLAFTGEYVAQARRRESGASSSRGEESPGALSAAEHGTGAS